MTSPESPRDLTSLPRTDIDCGFTLKMAALATLDAICCIPCCCFCGGCCGRHPAFLARMDSDAPAPGVESCQATCATQSAASIVVPCTICLCFWCCCGTAAPCARELIACTLNVDQQQQRQRQQQQVHPQQPPVVQQIE